jgi:hypothetical protein
VMSCFPAAGPPRPYLVALTVVDKCIAERFSVSGTYDKSDSRDRKPISAYDRAHMLAVSHFVGVPAPSAVELS